MPSVKVVALAEPPASELAVRPARTVHMARRRQELRQSELKRGVMRVPVSWGRNGVPPDPTQTCARWCQDTPRRALPSERANQLAGPPRSANFSGSR